VKESRKNPKPSSSASISHVPAAIRQKPLVDVELAGEVALLVAIF